MGQEGLNEAGLREEEIQSLVTNTKVFKKKHVET